MIMPRNVDLQKVTLTSKIFLYICALPKWLPRNFAIPPNPVGCCRSIPLPLQSESALGYSNISHSGKHPSDKTMQQLFAALG